MASNGHPMVSKDHPLNGQKKTHVRIYMSAIKLARNDDTRFPIIISYPLLSWYLSLWDTKMIYKATSKLTSQFPTIVVSVGYCIAPENRLPVQYHDAMEAILWVREEALNPKGEQWIRDYGDISRCYLHGSGCGGNIAFFAALEATRMELEPLKIVGNIMNEPMFGGMERKKLELQNHMDPAFPLCAYDLMWELSLPEGENRDHWYCNPIAEGPYTSAISKLCRCLVIEFYGDLTVDLQQEFVTMLMRHGVQIDVLFHHLGFHAIEMVARNG